MGKDIVADNNKGHFYPIQAKDLNSSEGLLKVVNQINGSAKTWTNKITDPKIDQPIKAWDKLDDYLNTSGNV